MTITIIPNQWAGVDIARLYYLVKKNESDFVLGNQNLSEIILEIQCSAADFEFRDDSKFILSDDDRTLKFVVACQRGSDMDAMCRLVSLQMEAVKQVAWAWAWATPRNIKKPKTATTLKRWEP